MKTMQQPPALLSFNHGAHTLRTVMHDGAPWFVAKDVCDALDFRDVFNATRGLDDDEKGTHNMSTLGGEQSLVIISESGLYSLIMKSRKAEAKIFKKWVTSEVLPSVRKNGAYVKGAEGLSPEAQSNLYAIIQGQLIEALLRYDTETKNDHWCSPSKQKERSQQAAEKIAKQMGIPLQMVLNAAMYGAESAAESAVEGKL